MLTTQSQWENGIDLYIHTLNHLLDRKFSHTIYNQMKMSLSIRASPNIKRSCLLSSESQRFRGEPLNMGSERGSVAYCGT